MNILAWLLLALAILLEVAGQVLFKFGLERLPPEDAEGGSMAFWRALPRNPWVMLGVASYAVEFGVWLAVLTLAPLSLAFPALSLSYCGVALASRIFLGERIDARIVTAMVLISAGVALVSA